MCDTKKQHWDDLIKTVNHPSFEREALKVHREKKYVKKGKFAQDLDQKLNQ
jgi:hypothetical protein